jgi:hypothetical protein
MLLIEDVVMNTNDDTNGQPIVCRSASSEVRRTDVAAPVDAASDDHDIFARMPPPRRRLGRGFGRASDSLPVSRSSGRRQPRRGERQRIFRDDQPTLRGRVHTGHPEVGHLPVTDLRCLREFVQGQPSADPAALVIHDDFQQSPAHRLRCLFAWTFPSGPPTFGDPLLCVFSHARWITAGIAGGQQPSWSSRVCETGNPATTRHSGTSGGSRQSSYSLAPRRTALMNSTRSSSSHGFSSTLMSNAAARANIA